MRRFRLLRHVDHSGVSGPRQGEPSLHVAEGVQFADGTVALRWYHPRYPATAIWPSIEGVIDIHGHGGDTEVEWVDDEPS